MEETPPQQEADGALAIAAVLGDLDAFEELVRRYRRAAIRIASGIAGLEAAEDIAQEALLLAFQALPDLEEPDRFAAWLSAITRNRALRWIRRETRAIHIGFDDALLVRIEKIASGDSRYREAAAEMREGIEELPESCRLLMRLRWLDEMPMPQIAAFTGLPLSTVKWRLHEGKKRLREWTGSSSGQENRNRKEDEHGKGTDIGTG